MGAHILETIDEKKCSPQKNKKNVEKRKKRDKNKKRL